MARKIDILIHSHTFRCVGDGEEGDLQGADVHALGMLARQLFLREACVKHDVYSLLEYAQQ